MRLSVDRTDPGYSSKAAMYKVFLNGEELKNCVTADDQKGVAIVNDYQANSKRIPKKTLHGKITFYYMGIGEDKK